MTVENVCEHGDHPAPDGSRFCSDECARCEAAPADEGEGCAGICRERPAPPLREENT